MPYRLQALIAVGVLIAALVERGSDRACARLLASRASWVVALDADPLRPGARAPGTVVGGECEVPVTVMARDGAADAGARVAVTGEALATGARLVIREATVVPVAGGRLLPRWRGRTGRAIDRLFGRDSALVRALVIADQRGIDPKVRDRFADAGLVHALSVSGLHVAIVAGALQMLLGALRLRQRVAIVAGLVATAGYVLLIGAPAPAVRAGAMMLALDVARLRGVPTKPWAVFLFGSLLPVARPSTVLDLGYQLSVLGMAGLVAAGALKRRLGWGGGGFLGAMRREVLTGVVACLVTTPLVAWHFGRASLVAPLSNIVAGPVIAMLQPALFVALLLEPFGGAGRLAAAGCRPLLAAMGIIADVAASIPGATIPVTPSLWGATWSGAAVVLAMVAVQRPAPARCVLLSLLSLLLVALEPRATRGEWTEVHMIDVGQGDAVALRSRLGRWVVVDAGGGWEGGNAGRRMVIPHLRRFGGPVEAVVMSHPHLDHVGGAPAVVRALRPRELWDGAYVGTSPSYRETLEAGRETGARWRRARPGERIVVDEIEIDVLAPDSAWMTGLHDANEASVVLLARIGGVRVLLTGDAETNEERWLVERLGDSLRADVLKLGHHGSPTSSGERFLDHVRPRLALVSVGAGNKYRHPGPEVLRRLRARRARVVRTDQSGSVVMRTDGRRIRVRTEEGEWELSEGPSPP